MSPRGGRSGDWKTPFCKGTEQGRLRGRHALCHTTPSALTIRRLCQGPLRLTWMSASSFSLPPAATEAPHPSPGLTAAAGHLSPWPRAPHLAPPQTHAAQPLCSEPGPFTNQASPAASPCDDGHFSPPTGTACKRHVSSLGNAFRVSLIPAAGPSCWPVPLACKLCPPKLLLLPTFVVTESERPHLTSHPCSHARSLPPPPSSLHLTVPICETGRQQ